MVVEHVELLVEEPSMEAFLRGLLPRILRNITFEIYPFRSKDELFRKLPARLRAYSQWLPESWRLVVIVDQDQEDCYQLKTCLEEIASEAALITRTAAAGRQYSVINRVVVEELEAWYFGDWEAVREAYPGVSPTIPAKKRYRDPDDIRGGTWEALERILKKSGHFESGFRKNEAARTLAQLVDPNRNRSRSFQVFYEALLEIMSQ